MRPNLFSNGRWNFPLVCHWSNYSLFHVHHRWIQSSLLCFHFFLFNKPNSMIAFWYVDTIRICSSMLFCQPNLFGGIFWLATVKLQLISCPRAVPAKNSRHIFRERPSRGGIKRSWAPCKSNPREVKRGMKHHKSSGQPYPQILKWKPNIMGGGFFPEPI